MSAAVVEVKQSPFERAIAKFGAYFEERGLTPADIPAAIVVHELIGLVIAAGAWTLCYRIQPSRHLATRLSSLAKGNTQIKIQQAYNAAMVQATNTVQKMSWLRNAPSVDAARLTTSLAESLCLRAAAKPGTFVFKLWASYQIVRVGKQKLGRAKREQKKER